VFFGSVGRFEAQYAGNFGAGGGRASVGDGVLDQFQNFLLAGCELGAIGHGGLLVGIGAVFSSSGCIFNQFSWLRKLVMKKA
jgi:hypothetical protein